MLGDQCHGVKQLIGERGFLTRATPLLGCTKVSGSLGNYRQQKKKQNCNFPSSNLHIKIAQGSERKTPPGKKNIYEFSG